MTALPGARPRERGFTLIELMIVIVLLAILAGIAVPSYRNYVLRANRADATAMLLKVRSAQEKFFLQNDRYMTDADLAARSLATSDNGYYTVTTAEQNPAPPPDFLLTAVPAPGGRQATDTGCASFTINDLGQRNSSPSPAATCWR